MLKELQEKQEKLVADARAAYDEIKKNTDESRAAELEQRHDTIMAEYDAITAKIEREERVAAMEAAEAERRAKKRPINPDEETRAQDGGDRQDAAKEYGAAFRSYFLSGFDMEALAPEHRALLRKGYQEVRTQVTNNNPAGGFTVPVELQNEIIRVMKDWGPMYDGNVVRELNTTSGNQFNYPTVDETGNNTTGSRTEGTGPADDNSGDVALGQLRIDAFIDITPWIKISFELLQDSILDFEAFIGSLVGERLGRRANARLTLGNGNGQPNGVVTAAAVGKNAAVAAALTADELIDLQHAVRAPYRRSPKCRWMFADTTLQAIRKLKDGQGNYLFQQGNITTGAPDRILDKPYSINDDVPAIGAAAKSVLFGDFSRYLVRKVGAPMIGTVRERFWPELGMAGLQRYDGELLDPEAIKALRHP